MGAPRGGPSGTELGPGRDDSCGGKGIAKQAEQERPTQRNPPGSQTTKPTLPMNTPSDSSGDSHRPSKPKQGNGTPPRRPGKVKRRKPLSHAEMMERFKATLRKAERLLAFGIAQENEHLRASEAPRQRARACAEKGDEAGAEAAWREVIAAEIQTGDAAFISKAYLHFGCWLLHVGQDESAFANSVPLVEVSRKAEFSFVLWKALEHRVVCATRLNLMAPAMEAAEEAIRLADGCEDLVDHRGWSRVLRGRSLLELGEVERASEDLEASREHFTDDARPKWQEDAFNWRIHWWELAAEIRMEQRDVRASVQAWAKVVWLRRALFKHRKESWHSVADALRNWADALRIDGQSGPAAVAEVEADRLDAEFDVEDAADAPG